MSLLSLKGIGHSFGERAVLDGVDLEVSSGEVVALIGPNGAGKSTLLSVIAGDLAPQRGEALVGGLPPQQWKPLQLARRRSVLLQSSSVSFSYAVSDVVAMGRTPWRKTERADDDARGWAADCEAVWHLVAALVRSRTDAQWRVVEMVARTDTQVEAARRLGMQPGSVTGALRLSRVREERAAHGALDRLLAGTDRAVTAS